MQISRSSRSGTSKQKAARWHNWLMRLVTFTMNDGTMNKIIQCETATWETKQIAKEIMKLYRELLISMKQRERIEP